MAPEEMEPEESGEEGEESEESLRDTLEDAFEKHEEAKAVSGEDFAQTLMLHLAESMKLARVYLASGETDALLAPLAESAIATRQAEIDTLQ